MKFAGGQQSSRRDGMVTRLVVISRFETHTLLSGVTHTKMHRNSVRPLVRGGDGGRNEQLLRHLNPPLALIDGR